MIHTIAFYLFAAMVIASAMMVIFARNPVHSVMWLILSFFNAAGLMVLVGAEFIAMLLVIVYVGAVAVLFLFVVMMLDIDYAEMRAGFMRNMPLGLLIALILLAEIVLGIGAYRTGAIELGTPDGTGAAPLGASNIEAIGSLMFTRYVFLFEAAGIILLVAMIGAIVLTHLGSGPARGQQNVSRQNRRRPEEATRNVTPEIGKGIEL
ncbi:MAG: NADH:ubiquinone oxidoreductase subunit J [Sphingomonadales bacterium CG12_big_fil_rev_8_21_14_0_65_65_10]|uniref:NADH-quinone oxidoreductase subunit J n=1 Tax=Blastomonas marina TaxID=1867408 RepID=A0ABQ1FA81_9SPHN|nr:NADH-quinone oxidoreductase subunit J [Blastomonas marina]PIW54740.1 MAG: NADH:ubiquinone oxidoreductase subunit J [Sphingomonadales bacterium CG12_big_fil_rev_8_21_14_0_65_65_10]WPZ04771.1 NADH-quinone oxidoreductase subunit J [Blastomonas marina]GGA04184.1 NADH:ubiquinone oxidoreductase subunit J [Blastomonas marina]